MIFSLLFYAAAQPWTIVLGGDIMLNGVSPTKSPFAAVKAIFKGADTAFANLEVPMTAIGKPTSHKTAAELRARTQFILRANPAHMKWVKAAGIKAVSLGNNHALDYGPLAHRRGNG